ncbi:hypothetical protein BV25DRAFT_1832996 [Artomyces pyxidatus]|uniref:Uncharacterized protein n=1 Tax=Artomyces pyxidatus TaxID=48021 RepID=A0ACB8SI55_9AGAM|nr:hypothetical protein BV25DRAFT_1832996 [Artomyces pyxidatus]
MKQRALVVGILTGSCGGEKTLSALPCFPWQFHFDHHPGALVTMQDIRMGQELSRKAKPVSQ